MTNPYAPPGEAAEPQPSSSQPDARCALSLPSAAILFLAGTSVAFDLLGIAEDVLVPITPRLLALGVPEHTVLLAFHVCQVAGAWQMRSKRLYGLACFGAFTCCIPGMSPFVVLGIPFGVWAFRCLLQPETMDAFDRQAS